ncbi:tetratricopeptide repeat protein 14 [Caerostris extrusa]|uniref:Tetratricopeptide repeat protein 14 n=1 Tax=Caerostris extrusa TaxID=172846 RepID=A0AAV4MKR0_CAEEX|nr:tetratricopeptide repeat protein 14 [Caerostris extrusa]
MFFYPLQNLNRLDVLYLQILDCTDPNKYTLLVLAKHGILAKLEDLSLDVYLPRLHKDQIFNEGDLIKAALWSCSIDDRRLYVTLDDTVFEGSDVPAVKLGRIEPSDLPYYITCSKIGETYSEYVKESKEYKNEGLWLKELKDFGFDTHSFHSFFEEWDGKIYPAAENYSNLKQKLDLEDSVLMMNKSIQHFDAGNIDRSFKYINEALSMKPDNVMALVYRGTLYANVGKLRQALIDTEEALRIDPACKRAKQQMSQLLVSASEVHFIDKLYFKWKECVALARSYDSNNREAKELMDIANIEFPDKKAISEGNISLSKIEEVRRIYKRTAPDLEKRMSEENSNNGKGLLSFSHSSSSGGKHRKQPHSRHSRPNRHKKHK